MLKMHFCLKVILVAISVACVWLSPAAFTPAVFLSFLLLLVGGLYGFAGTVLPAAMLLGFNSLAIALSPMEILGESITTPVIAFSIFVVGWGGLVTGLLRKESSSTVT